MQYLGETWLNLRHRRKEWIEAGVTGNRWKSSSRQAGRQQLYSSSGIARVQSASRGQRQTGGQTRRVVSITYAGERLSRKMDARIYLLELK